MMDSTTITPSAKRNTLPFRGAVRRGKVMELRFPGSGLRAQSATLGIDTKRDSNAVGVAFSRRRYPQQDNGLRCVGGVLLNSICNILPNPCSPSCATGNALGWLVTAVTRSRIVRHVPTYQLSRAHVSSVTNHQ